MFCSRCGKPVPDGARFCAACGQPTAAAAPNVPYTPPVPPAPPAAPKGGNKGIIIAAIAVAACLFLFAVGMGVKFIIGNLSLDSPDLAEKSESLFEGLVDYEFKNFLFRTPDDIYWEDEYLGDGEIILDAEDFSVFALAYNAKALKDMDVRSEDDLIDFAAQRWSTGDNYDVESFSGGHYIVVDDTAVIGVYMGDKQGWLIAVEIHDSSLFYDYLSLADFIATSGIITDS